VTAHKPVWTVRLTDSAESDFRRIVQWTSGQFGPAQARRYAKTLSSALQELADDPLLHDVRKRDDILPGLMTLHVARNRRKGRHFILFRVFAEDAQIIDILRILHDAMDLPQHL
jgi:toxin ParE1/3/4